MVDRDESHDRQTDGRGRHPHNPERDLTTPSMRRRFVQARSVSKESLENNIASLKVPNVKRVIPGSLTTVLRESEACISVLLNKNWRKDSELESIVREER